MGYKEFFISAQKMTPPIPIYACVAAWPFLLHRCNDSDGLTFSDPGKRPVTIPKHQAFQGFRGDARVINVIFRT